MKLLFITRKFPPSIGGMETLSAALAREFPKLVDTKVIAWGHSQIFLPFFMVYAFAKSAYLIKTKKITHVHLGDALLTPLGVLLKTFFKVRCSVSVHGLDVTFSPPIYQKMIANILPQMDKIICVSRATLSECIKRGVPKSKCQVIPNGIYPDNYKIIATREDLENVAGLSLINKKVLLTVGRLVPRKGVYWFVKNVVPKLDDKYVYLIVGDGPDKDKIEQFIDDNDLRRKAIVLGRLSHKKLKVVYNASDAFVMPNIKVKNDLEGFGIVALEANSAGLPVIASATDGIKDVVINGKNGYLLDHDMDTWPGKIDSVIKEENIDKDSMLKWIVANFHWRRVSASYLKSFKNH